MSRGSTATAPLARAAPLFAALGDPTRLALVGRLCEAGPASTSRLAQGAAVTRQAVTKHLEVLAGAGLVRDARVGRERVWELRAARVADARRALDDISRRWDDALDRLRAYVED
ncbi:MAG TPA: metalloregulator ArsR/SmtB family transcription factor [Anaeromyxobacteraceae bacterium]|nr:metalloregulator ArsR/SmtB family transcription factor [Anaeromyxobacteraceae bacterium]